MFFIRGNYELPTKGAVLVVIAVGIALILVGAVRLGLVLIGAFTAVSLFQLLYEKWK